MAVLSPAPAPGVGDLLRQWRQHRRFSQLQLAVEAEVSPRHLSFVETGRSRPSRELVSHLAEHLDVPLRERNTLLLAAGYAPIYAERALDAGELEPVRDALEKILGGHEPYPAIVVDGRWNLVSANNTAFALMGGVVSADLLAPPGNALRMVLHPQGLAPYIANLEEYAAHVVARLDRQAIASQDAELFALARELRDYPGVPAAGSGRDDVVGRLFSRLIFCPPDGSTLTFFSTIATFGTALDVTVSELAIEQFFPADASTAAELQARALPGAGSVVAGGD